MTKFVRELEDELKREGFTFTITQGKKHSLLDCSKDGKSAKLYISVSPSARNATKKIISEARRRTR